LEATEPKLPSTPADPAGAQAYDALVARLERVVADLEQGNLTLEQSIEKFAEGVQLAREAGRKLDEAERRIEVLVRSSDGTQGTVPLEDAGRAPPER
jgi:exodeoxyribonuclease VII small subunit